MPGAQGHAHGNNQANDPPLLTPAVPHGNAHPNPNPAPNLGHPPPNIFGLHIPFPLGNHNGNNNPPGGGPPNPPNPDPDPNSPSLIDSLPLTLSTLHIPQITPAGLREVVDRCQGIQLLGIVMGPAFAAQASVRPGKTTGRIPGRSKGRASSTLIRSEVNVLSDILARAKTLRELIIDASPAVFAANATDTGVGAGAPQVTAYALLTPAAVRMLMHESPLLRRIVAEGRVWEVRLRVASDDESLTMGSQSTTPVPFPRCSDIQLTLYPARHGPGAGYNHVHGPPGFGMHGGGYGQMESGNDHWFWLSGNASGKGYSGY